MIRLHTLPALVTLVLTAGLLAGCDLGSSASYAEPGAPTAAFEILGSNSTNDWSPLTAQQFIDHVRLGRGLDAEGQVPQNFAADGFIVGEPIHVSMGVADAPAGSVVRVAVHDAATDRVTWVQDKQVAPGRSYLSFAIDAELIPATYRAEVIIGDEVVVGKEFQVLAPKA